MGSNVFMVGTWLRTCRGLSGAKLGTRSFHGLDALADNHGTLPVCEYDRGHGQTEFPAVDFP